MLTVLTYPIELHPAEEGGFTVTSPVLNIVTEGDTEEEAIRNAGEAILCHLKGCASAERRDPASKMVLINVPTPDTLVA